MYKEVARGWVDVNINIGGDHGWGAVGSVEGADVEVKYEINDGSLDDSSAT